MNEQYVSFEVAKLLKEEGFDWKVFHFYDENGHLKHREGDCYSLYNWNYPTNDEYGSQYCSAPTQQMACDWLREEKNIYVTAVPDIGNSLRFYPAIYVIKGEIPEEYWFEYINSVVEELHKSYDKPQQAVKAALQYVLTNLI